MIHGELLKKDSVITISQMDDYWNTRFVNEKLMWGIEPSNVAKKCEPIFKENNVRNILIMGAGYGRNGKYFTENGYNVDGIEYSMEAINLGKIFCPEIHFIEGSVLDIKLNKKYDALFCYSIMHLFQKNDRETFMRNCISHCNENGIIVISCFSVKDKTFGIGTKIEENTFEIKKGKIVHFFDEEEIINISSKLIVIKYDYVQEKIETKDRIEEYNMIYGIYKKGK